MSFLLIEVSYVKLNLPWDLDHYWNWVFRHVIVETQESYLRDVPSESMTYVFPIINKPFLRKGLKGHLVLCTNKVISQEEGLSLASDPG